MFGPEQRANGCRGCAVLFEIIILIFSCLFTWPTGLSHMRESVLLHEESLRLQRMCRELKKRDHLSTFLRRAHDVALSAYTRALGDDEFGEALDPPPILGRSFAYFYICVFVVQFHFFTISDLSVQSELLLFAPLLSPDFVIKIIFQFPTLNGKPKFLPKCLRRLNSAS